MSGMELLREMSGRGLKTPAIIITGIYGMNVKHLPFAESPHSWGIVMCLILAFSGGLLFALKKLRWI